MAPNNLLERLVAFEPAPFPVISVYLNTEADQNGARDTLIALTLSQVDEMFLSASEQDARDDLTGKAEEFIPGLPEDVEENGRARSAVIADELVARARQTNAGVTFIENAAKLAACGGVGATLRFRL